MGGVERRQFIFSCWDADISHRVSWTSENCKRFGGEGAGSHCILVLPIKEGVKYRFRVSMSGSNETTAHWTGTVWDTATRESWNVGTLVYPHVSGFVGFGKLKVHSDDFLEYFEGDDCEGAATSGAGVLGPYFHNRTVTPSQAWPSYSDNGCYRISVDRCIPGESCGFPRVHLSGGRDVIQNTSNGEELWLNPPSPTPSPPPSPIPSPSSSSCSRQNSKESCDATSAARCTWCVLDSEKGTCVDATFQCATNPFRPENERAGWMGVSLVSISLVSATILGFGALCVAVCWLRPRPLAHEEPLSISLQEDRMRVACTV